MVWRIVELIHSINDISPNLISFEELNIYYEIISQYNIEHQKYKGGHSYGERL